jgi:hypothetical protein
MALHLLLVANSLFLSYARPVPYSIQRSNREQFDCIDGLGLHGNEEETDHMGRSSITDVSG